ncbi:hypothetical protein NHQ30_009591 [Ciborinia camelliae]|nr:hypothetical protein NHQ30_009591 [Ciborinia camelliae]
MDDAMDSREDTIDHLTSSQEDTMDYTMDHAHHHQESTMDYTMNNEATNQTLSQLPDASDLSEEEDDPPILELARSIGIARDHQLDDTSVDDLLLMKENINHTFLNDLNQDHLPQLDIQVTINLDERLFVSQGAARLLGSVAQNESQESIDALIYPLLGGSRDVKKMRLELPLLRSDHESDVRGFSRKDGFELKPKDIKLPLELVSIENNEGLEFPPDFYNFETETFETIANEKIEVTRNSMIYLQTALKVTLTRDDEQEIWESVRTHSRKFPISNHVTPPLSPILASLPDSPLHFLPSGCEIPLYSDPESLTSLDLEKIEDEVFREDLPTPIRDRHNNQAIPSTSGNQCVKLGDLYSPPECIKFFDPSSSPLEKKHTVVENMKIEELLTPPKPLEESGPKSVRFSNIVEELLISSRPQSGFSEPILETKFFEEAFGESGEQAKHRVEQERLADTRNRVEVPAMDFSIPGPPWLKKKFHSVNAASSMLRYLIDDVGIDLSERWPGIKKLHTKLPWIPFKHDLGNALEESLDDENTWESFVHGQEDNKVITSSDLTWKMEGLRVLRQEADDDDDELETGSFSKGEDDISSLPRKRKSEMEDIEHRQKQGHQDSQTREARVQGIRPLISQGMRNDISKMQDNIKTKRGQLDSEEKSSLHGGIFSAKDGLSNFMEIRGAKKPKLMESAHFQAPNAPLIPPNQQSLTKESQIQDASSATTHSPLPTPTITTPTTPISIILSSTILKNRPLMRSLQTLLPTLQICERDFSAHNTTIWNPGSVVRSPITSTLTHEADMIISPTTGLILTTLQHIKQKPLPGHKTAVPIRDRLEKVSGRYEDLILLVSSPSTGLGDSDCLAWADFVGFTLTLQASIIVNYVPVDTTNAEDQAMAKYISHLIIQHHIPSATNLELLDQESYWEIWLRRAGMNAYAAQATISELKAPGQRCSPGDEGYELEMQMVNEQGPYGLALFVLMGVADRVKRLGGLVGRGVLERVGRAVDQTWE